MNASPLRIGYCLSLSGALASNGKTAQVAHLKDGKVLSFHCYVAVPILLKQLGIFKNLSAAIRR